MDSRNLRNVWSIVTVCSVFILSGCVVRSYKVTRDRVDQKISGNQGYLKGQGAEGQEKKKTRTVQMVEIELHSPIKFERGARPQSAAPAPAERMPDDGLTGNRGYITRSYAPDPVDLPEIRSVAPSETTPETLEDYTVQNGDTLQKISQKLYGTTKQWYRIYKANQEVLKGPDKIYPGQVIKVPVEKMKEPAENLK